MNSAKLSQRARQPGHDRTFRHSEESFIVALRTILDAGEWEITDHPRGLEKMIDGRFGIVPEAAIYHRQTERVFYFEVKKQGPNGNADERACKHHTVEFYRRLSAHTEMPYHAFATIMCENLATDERYTVKHPYYFEQDHYFLWVDYDVDLLADYVAMLVDRYLLGP